MKDKKNAREYGNKGAFVDNDEEALLKGIGDIEVLIEDEKNNDSVKKKRTLSFVLTNLLLIFSILVAIATGFILSHYTEYRYIFKKIIPYDKYSSTYITTYLGHQSKELARNNAFLFLKQKKEELKGIEASIRNLADEKNCFISEIDEKKKIFNNHISVTDLNENENRLKSIALLRINKTNFRRDINHRLENYLNNYDNRKTNLLSKREKTKDELYKITSFINSIDKSNESNSLKYEDVSFNKSVSFNLDKEKAKYLKSYLFSIDNQEYQKAIDILNKINELGFDQNEKIFGDILEKLLFTLRDYRDKLSSLKESSPFAEIKMAYLREDYRSAEDILNNAEKDQFIKPVLSGLKNAINNNKESSYDIKREINNLDDIKIIITKAKKLESRKEYEKALNIYSFLLLSNIQQYDKENLQRKIRSIMEIIVKDNLIRNENTKASKYLGTAKKFYKNGDYNKAIDYYKLIITECPNSYYVETALSKIEDLLKNNPDLNSI